VSLLRNITSGLRSLLLKKQMGKELDEELSGFLEMAAEEKMKQGMSRREVLRAVRLEHGGREVAREVVRAARWESTLETCWLDVRFGARMLRKNAGFTIAVVLTLALSIGANTAIFSIVNALLLKGLPYPHPERLGAVYCERTGPDSFSGRRNIDGEQWELLRDDVPSLLSAISTLRTTGVNLQAGSHTQYLHAGRVSAQYFDVLGLQPTLGRNFTKDEDRPHGPKTAILSYALWRTVFGGSASVVGQAIRLKGELHTIIGVLPEAAVTPMNADLYTALQASREGEGKGTNFSAILRLRDGATWQQADAEMNRAWARSQRVHDYTGSNPGAQVAYYSVPLQKGETDVLRPQVLALMLSAGFILIIACANLAGLTLVRVLRRSGEIAMRAALGASSWQIQRQLWVENLLLAFVGGIAGVGVGFVALRGLLLLLPEHFLPVASVTLDSRVLGFTLLLSLLTSVLFGILPALTMRRVDLRPAMGNRSVIGGGSVRLRQGLIAGEVALTVVLLASAGLLIRTLIHLETTPPGFNPNGIITAKASLDDVRYDPPAFRKLLNQSLSSMREIPGVQGAAAGLSLPYERALLNGITLSDGPQAGHLVTTNFLYVTPGYFDVFQIPVVMGRGFSEADGPDEQQVVIVNQTFARKFFHDVNPVGRHLDKDMLIVGVVADTLLSSVAGLNPDSAPLTKEEAIYVPAAQMVNGKFLSIMHAWFQPSWIVRIAQPVAGLTSQMQSALASADPNLPFSGFYDMKDLMAGTLATQRIEVALLTTMACLALLLSAVGIFALVANIVAHRTREIGIRIALGSTVHKAMMHIGGSGVRAAGAGLVLGLLLCVGALRSMRSVLYGVGVYDAQTIAIVVLTLSMATLLATAVPTLRVARIDPAKALRDE
jgi:predicted permease